MFKETIHVWGRDNCKYCDEAKALLEAANWPYHYHNIERNDGELLLFREAFPTARSVPQIALEFSGYIGTCEDLRAWLKRFTPKS